MEFFRGSLLLYRYTEGSEKGCGSFFLVHFFWVVVCSSGFVIFFHICTFKVALGAHVSFLLSERSFGNSNFCGRTAVVLADYLHYEREMSNVFLT